jgi:hypothetical protein
MATPVQKKRKRYHTKDKETNQSSINRNGKERMHAS